MLRHFFFFFTILFIYFFTLKLIQMHIAVLGAGMIGRAIADDLSFRHQVTSFDLSENALHSLKKKSPGVKTIQANLADYSQYKSFLAPFDIVVSAVPGFMG